MNQVIKRFKPLARLNNNTSPICAAAKSGSIYGSPSSSFSSTSGSMESNSLSHNNAPAARVTMRIMGLKSFEFFIQNYWRGFVGLAKILSFDAHARVDQAERDVDADVG